MHAVLAWVAIIVVLSLALIRLLNLQIFSQRLSKRNVPASAWIESGPSPAPVSSQPRVNTTPAATLHFDAEKSYGGFKFALCFEAGKGTVGLLGASGAGKSMTLRLLAGVAAPDRGRIVLNGKILFDSDRRINLPFAQRRIGVVFQDYALFPHMTVAENVAFGLQQLPKEEQRVRVRRQLEQMHISDLAARYPGEISGGQRQRVALARCMAIEPDALLLDEPFAVLDPHLRRQTEERLRATLSGYNGAVIFVTHDMEEAFRFCSELLVLDNGHKIAFGPKEQLFEQPGTVAAACLTGCKNIVSTLQTDPGHLAVAAWNCELALARPSAGAVPHLGYRSHHFRFQQNAEGENCFPCWLMETSEAPHEVTLYLRLHQPPQLGDQPHLQADLPKEQWRALAVQPQPWTIQLDPARLLLLQD